MRYKSGVETFLTRHSHTHTHTHTTRIQGSSSTTTGNAGKRRIVITTPAGPNARTNLARYTSTDEAETWSPGVILAPGPAGYSDAVQLNASTLCVLFENGDVEFAQQISFGLLSASELGPYI